MREVLKKIAVCVLTGTACGVAGGAAASLFYRITGIADTAKVSNGYLMYFLPLAGIIVVFLYRRFDEEKRCNTGEVFLLSENGGKPPVYMAPLIFIAVPLTYLTGGSLGRVGASFQLSSGITFQLGRLRENRIAGSLIPENDMLGACGIAAGFSVMLNSPAAGAVIGVEILVLSYRKWYYLIATSITAAVCYGMSYALDTNFTDLHTEVSADSLREILSFKEMLVLLSAAFIATLSARLFCYGRRYCEKALRRVFKNEYIRVIAGAIMVIIIVKLLGTFRYSTIGLSEACEALSGKAEPPDFFWKLLLTCITLGSGFRGGEISPVIFIGSTLGCVFGIMTGVDPSVTAAIVLVGMLSSVMNCTLGIFIFACESISMQPEMCIIFAVTSVIAHVFSGVTCLYGTQRTSLLKGKLRLP